MTSASWVPVRDALVLAAGNGDRFQNGTRQSKLLQPVLGQPLILRTLATAAEAGITSFHVVLGYQARAAARGHRTRRPAGTARALHLQPRLAPRERRVGAGRARTASRSPLRAADGRSPVRSPRARAPAPDRCAADESLLAVDSRPAPPEVAAEATKVRMSGDRITAIGKELGTYDALDTGLFVCAPSLFAALDDCARGGRHDAQRRHPAARRARPDARRRHRRRGVVRHRHDGRSRDGRNACSRRSPSGSRHDRTPRATTRTWSAPSAGARSPSASSSSSPRSTTSTSALAFGTIRSSAWRCRWRCCSAACGISRARGRGRGAFPQPRTVSFLRLARVRLAAEAFSYLTLRGIAGEPLKVVLLGDSRRRRAKRPRRSRSSGSPTWSARRSSSASDRSLAIAALPLTHVWFRVFRAFAIAAGVVARADRDRDRGARHLLPVLLSADRSAARHVARDGTRLAVRRGRRAADARTGARQSRRGWPCC